MISFHEIDLWTETFFATVLTFSAGIDRGQMRKGKKKKSLEKQVQVWSLEIKPVLKAQRETPLPSNFQPCGRMKAGNKI